MDLIVEPGKFSVMVGSSSDDIRLQGEFEVTTEYKVESDRTYFSKVEVEAVE